MININSFKELYDIYTVYLIVYYLILKLSNHVYPYFH